jgi:hypothetical protein
MDTDLFPIQVIEREGEVWVNISELVCFLRVCAQESEDNPLLFELADRLDESLCHVSED